MFLHYLKIAWRHLVYWRIRSIVSIMALAIGFVAFVFGGYWWYWENHFDTFHPNGNRLYAIVTYGLTESADGNETAINQLHKADAEWFARSLPEIEEMCIVSDYRMSLELDGKLRYYPACQVDSSFFQLFHHRFLDGGYKGVVADGKSVILTRRLAMQLFGTVYCAGREVNLGKDRKGKDEIRKVAGVIEDYPDNSEFLFSLLIYDQPDFRLRNRAHVYVRLKKNTDSRIVAQKVKAHKSVAVDPYGIDVPSLWSFQLCSLSDIHLTCYPQLHSRFRNIRILALAGLLAFVSALMNHLVLFIGNQQRKDREYITRVSLGSSGKRMWAKMFVELFLPVMLSWGVAVCLIELFFPVYQEYTLLRQNDWGIGMVNQMNRWDLFIGVGKGMLWSGLLFAGISILPVYFLLKQHHQKIVNREYSVQVPLLFRRILIIGQIFIGTLFFIAALGVYNQVYYVTHKDRGIDVQNVIQIKPGFETTEKINREQLRNELKSSPYIEDVTMTNDPVLSPHGIYYGNEVGYVPVKGRNWEKFKAEGDEDYLFIIEENFFHFFRIRLLEGTLISAENPYDFVVNETGLRQLGFPDLLQRSLEPRDNRLQWKVAGIVQDYNYAPLQYPVRKVFFYVERGEVPFNSYHYYYVRYQPENREKAWQHVREIMGKYDRGEVSKEEQLTELSAVIEEFNRPEKVIFMLFSILAALCILISSFGIYSLVALSAEQRRKEIAIRKVNGATFRKMFQLFLKEYLVLVGIGGVCAGLAGYRLVQFWLETYANHAKMNGGWFIVIVFIVFGIVLSAVGLQVKKALKSNPAEALKED